MILDVYKKLHEAGSCRSLRDFSKNWLGYRPNYVACRGTDERLSVEGGLRLYRRLVRTDRELAAKLLVYLINRA